MHTIKRLSDRWSIGWDRYNWILREHYETKGKDGPGEGVRNHYYATPLQALHAAAMKELGDTPWDDWIAALERFEDEIRVTDWLVKQDGAT